jgi:phosphomannomutase
VVSGGFAEPACAFCVHVWTGFLAAAGEGRRGWALLRASLHDPLLVINIESEVEGGARTTAAQVSALLW